MRRVQGKSPLLRLSFPICTVGSVDWLQLPSKSFIKQASLSVTMGLGIIQGAYTSPD